MMKKPVLILLHGALGRASQFLSLMKALEKEFDVFSFDFSGHGDVQLKGEPFTMELFIQDVLYFMEAKKIDKAHFFGYSMGGYVATYLSIKHPEKVHSFCTLATKFDWDEESAIKEVKKLDAEKMMLKVPKFAELLNKRFYPFDWRSIVGKTADMMIDLGKNRLAEKDYGMIVCKALFMVGDKDEMVSVSSTMQVYKLTPNGALAVLPDTYHPIESVKVERLAFEITDFIKLNL